MYHYNVSTFRAERICHLEMVDAKAVEKPKGFSLDRYSRQIFGIIANDIDMYIEARWTRDTFRVFIIVLVRNTNLLYNLKYKVKSQGYPYMDKIIFLPILLLLCGKIGKMIVIRAMHRNK